MSPLISLIIGLGAIITAIFLEGSSIQSILLPAPMILVIFGTLGAAMLGSTIAETIFAFKSLGRLFTYKERDPRDAIAQIVSFTETARSKVGVAGLEERIDESRDPLVRIGLPLIIDAEDTDVIADQLYEIIEAKRARDKVAWDFFNKMGGYAPTIGIIGTVISLVHVLENLADPTELGHMIAAAFVATLWGILSANIFWLPFGARLKRLSELDIIIMSITASGLLSLAEGKSVRVVRDRMNAALPPHLEPVVDTRD